MFSVCCCSSLEGAETTLLSASGMCAATTMLLALVPAGGHIVTTTDCYRRTRQFIQTVLPKMSITVSLTFSILCSALVKWCESRIRKEGGHRHQDTEVLNVYFWW